MEPLLPDPKDPRLSELSQAVAVATGRLDGAVHCPAVRAELASLIRTMNCYYSNLIEGHRTLPRDIEQANQDKLSTDPEQRNNQLLAQAHIDTEEAMVLRLEDETLDVYAPEFICWIHEHFYSRLPDALHVSHTESGEEYRVTPGKMREVMVDVGRHTPPDFSALQGFMDRFHVFYGQTPIRATDRLTAIAAAHHRLAWIHPFGDGNGRVVRLHSHALLLRHGLDGGGLWTLSRGLARMRETYFTRLQEADRPRENDYDGRGNLSARALSRFCVFFLETILDQVQFMSGLLDLTALRTRIERYFQFEALHLPRHQEAIMKVTRALADEGEFPRERVKQITGKGATTAAEIIKLGLAEGYFQSPSQKGILRIAFPSKTLPFYFPSLFMDLPVVTK
ncbi:MAG: Fic family protein [Kiritimatiellae bacterium]|nr:Fic family protein [Kiritimatiellia bacterium]